MERLQITKIGLVDDHNLFRRTLSDLISQKIENFKVIIEASNGKDLIDRLKHLEVSDLPDMIIVDVNMPIMDGFQTTHWLKHNYQNIKVIALSTSDDETNIIRMLRVGVDGYLLKRIDVPELCLALKAVAENEIYYAESFTPGMLTSYQNKADQSDQLNKELFYLDIWNSLSDRERELIRLCCSEITYKEIAEQMKISFSYMGTCRDKIFAKFKVKNRIALAILILKNRII